MLKYNFTLSIKRIVFIGLFTISSTIFAGSYEDFFKATQTDEVKVISASIKNILEYYKLKASSDIINQLVNLINNNIECLFRQLKYVKSVSPSIIKKMINSNKKLEIFK